MRAWGEKVLIGIVLNAAASRTELKSMLENLAAGADLNPKQRDAVLWLLGSLEPLVALESHAAAVVPRDGGMPSQPS